MQQNGEDQISWEQYYQSARYLAQLIEESQDWVIEFLFVDNADVHVCYLACIGVVAVGAGWKQITRTEVFSDVTGASYYCPS